MSKVSVIIPAYNAMRYLPETVDSLLSQSYGDFEALVINDGSTDHIVEWFSEVTDPRVKIITQENRGLAGARNTGITYSSGEYLAFLDADDLWEPTKIAKQVKVLDENPDVGLVYTWVSYIDQNGQSTGKILKNKSEGKVWKKLIEHNIVECGSVAMVRRICFEEVGEFDRSLGSYIEDWDMWLRISRHYDFKVAPEPLVYYRQHSNSASKNWKEMEKSFSIVIEKTFRVEPENKQYLKNRSYGFSNFCLAWKPLQSAKKDWKTARLFQQKALDHDPSLRFSKENLRLNFAILLMRWLGENGYDNFIKLLHKLRRTKLKTLPN